MSPDSRLHADEEPAQQDHLTRLTVMTATGLETWAARRALPRGTNIVQVGVGLSESLPRVPEPIVSCGLAGALIATLPPGTVIIPASVGLATGERLTCEPELVAKLVAAARALGMEPVTASLLTTTRLVTGAARHEWAKQGYVAVDMESGSLLQRCRGAVVRVILDTPAEELATDWEAPWRILYRPHRWPEACRLALHAPRYARLAAAVINAAIQSEH